MGFVEDELNLESEDDELDLDSEDMSVGLLWFPQIPVMRLQTAPTSQRSPLQTQVPSFVVPPEALHNSVNFLSSSFVIDEELALLLEDVAELEYSLVATGIQLASSQ